MIKNKSLEELFLWCLFILKIIITHYQLYMLARKFDPTKIAQIRDDKFSSKVQP